MEDKNEILEEGRRHTYRVPAGYFETLPDTVLSRILAEETPLLHSISKQQVYSMPAGYFDKVINIPATTKAPGKIVQIKGYRRIIQYAAAAMLAGVLVSGAFMFTDSKNYLGPAKTYPVNIEPTVPGDSSNTNDAAVDADENVLPGVPSGNTVKRMPTFATKVASLSDYELENYLDENSQPEPIQLPEEDTEI